MNGRLVKTNNPEQVPSGNWLNAKNILYNKDFKSIINEFSADYKNQVPYTFIGEISTPEGVVLFSTNNNVSEIGFYNGEYSTIIKDSQHLLNFNKENIIDGVFKYNYKKEIIIAWCDGINITSNRPYLLNINSLPFTLDANKEFIDITDINKMYLFPDVKYPYINTNVVDNGNLQQGTYWVTLRYKLNNFDYLNTVGLSPRNSIFEYKEENNTYYTGLTITHRFQDSDYSSYISKSIKISLLNLDTRFDYCDLIVIHKNNEKTKYYKIATISTSTNTYLFDGNNMEELSASEIFMQTRAIEKCNSMTSCNNSLLLFNLVERQVYDYQKFANSIKVDYIKLENEGFSTYEHERNNTLIPEEVYGVNIHLVFKDGIISEGFHIPGRDKEIIHELNNLYGVDIEEDAYIKTLQPLYPTYFSPNEIINEDIRFYQTRNTADNSYTGQLGYWKNKNEYYPDLESFDIWDVDVNGNPINTGQTLRNKNVRHHKMPNLNSLAASSVGTTTFYRIGLDVKNIPIPNDLRPLIQGFIISYNTRNNDRTIYGNVIPYNWQAFDYCIVGNLVNNISRLTNSFDLMATHENTNSLYLKRTITTNNNYDTAIDPVISDIRINTSRFDNIYSARTTLSDKRSAYDIGKAELTYVPYNSTIPALHNSYSESTIHAKTDGTITQYMTDARYDMYILIKYLDDIYIDFYNNEVSPFSNLCTFNTNSHTSALFTREFDGHVNMITQGFTNYSDGFLPEHYRAGFVSYPSYDSLFASHRQKISTQTFFDYYDQWRNGDKTSDINPHTIDSLYRIPFDFTLSKLNNIQNLTLINPFTDNNNISPFTIIKSNQSSSESKVEMWRTFLVNNYYNATFNRGEGIKVIGIQNTLFIQYRKGLFISSIKDVLNTDEISAYLGVGDIFDRPPTEINEDVIGGINCTHVTACAYTTIGLVVVDTDNKLIWIVSTTGSLEISNIDIQHYIDQRLNVFINDKHSPYYDNGVHIIYDKEYKRLLITKLGKELINGIYNPLKDRVGAVYLDNGDYKIVTNLIPFTSRLLRDTDVIDRSFTLSYIQGKGFISFHDYLPNKFAKYGNKLIGLLNTDNVNKPGYIFEHNIKTSKGTFYDKHGNERLYTSYLDVIINAFPKNIRWTEVNWETSIIDLLDNYTTKTFNETFTHIMVYNDRQCSNIINLVDNYLINNRNINETWHFNKFRDQVLDKFAAFIDIDGNILSNNLNSENLNLKNYFDKSKFFSKFVVVRSYYDNIYNKEIIINDINVKGLTSRM